MIKIFTHHLAVLKVWHTLLLSFRTLVRLFFLSLFVISSNGITASIVSAQQQPDRPKIGLALSGGGARGAAHVGVIQVLEELNIPIDYIAGTSMGAVVGGLYASGMTSDEIAQQLEQIDWESVFEDKPTRPERTQRRKDDDRTYLFDGRIGVSESGLNFAKAKVIGQKFDLILKSLTLPVTGITNFDDLPIPFRAVAMDITNGDEVVLSEGDLAVAMHASMAIPGAFAPVELNGKLLVDGGAANNLPISVARDMGADIVIAIDISTPLLNRDELTGALTIISQLTGLLTRRNTEAQIKTLTKQDVLIIPDLGNIATMDFEHVVQAIDKGKQAAQLHQQQLAQLSIDQPSYLDLVAKQESDNKQYSDTVIHFVRFENDSEIDERVLRAHFGIEAGQQIDLDKVELGITNIYSLDLFETVTYDFVTEDGNTGLVIKAKQKSWGTNYLQGGFELASDFGGGNSEFNIGLAYTHQPINRLNGEWRTAIQLGEEPAVLTEIYQPLDTRARFFTHGVLSWGRRDVRLFNDSTSRAEVEYDLTEKKLQLAVGRNFGTWGDVRIGVTRITGDADVSIGGPSFSNSDYDDGYVFTRARVDTLDNLDFPRFGYLSTIEWLGSSDTLGADDDYDQVNLYLAHARSWGNDSIIASIDYGSTVSGDAPIHGRYQLGGFMNLSGISFNELSGQNFGLASFVYQRRLSEGRFISTYLGVGAQVGNVWEDKSDIGTNDLIASGTLFVGTDTPVGPVYLGFGHAEGGDNAGYLFLGQPFFR